jgi:hypothetical protein
LQQNSLHDGTGNFFAGTGKRRDGIGKLWAGAGEGKTRNDKHGKLCRRIRTRTSLSLAIGEMQGDFRKMQGGARRNLGKSYQISIAWMVISLLQQAGRSREADLA